MNSYSVPPFEPKIIKSTNKVFFGSRQSGKTVACIEKFIEHYPNVIYVHDHPNTIRDIAEKIYRKVRQYDEKISVGKIINQHMWSWKIYDNPSVQSTFKNHYKILDDAEVLDIITQVNKQFIQRIIREFNFITSSDGRIIQEYDRIEKEMKIQEILK